MMQKLEKKKLRLMMVNGKKNQSNRTEIVIGVIAAVVMVIAIIVYIIGKGKQKMKNKITGKLLVLIISICILLCGCGNSKDDTTGKKSAGKCTISVDCSTIWDNEDMLDKSIKDYVPKDGVILKERTVSYYDGETVYDVLKRELKKDNILMEASFTGDSVYVEGHK